MGIDLKKNEKLTKFITLILVGLLLLLVIGPLGKTDRMSIDKENKAKEDKVSVSTYYEQHLKEILEKSYGVGTMDVMVNVKAAEKSYSIYDNNETGYIIDGVLIVANVNNPSVASDITFAVCALFDLPAHKVFVIVK